MKNKIKIPLVFAITPLIILYTPLYRFFSDLIHEYIPCPYESGYAAHCIGYDTIFVIFLFGIFILSLVIILIKSVKYYRNHKKL
jgi:hypothetical protein